MYLVMPLFYHTQVLSKCRQGSLTEGENSGTVDLLIKTGWFVKMEK